jgi:dinuclear metal center YbgI/SA1388 family protein
MQIKDVVRCMDEWAQPSLQESYDNAGLLTGNPYGECSGILVSLDCTEEIIEEAIARNCNMVIAHHPVIFKALKKITGKNYVERTLIKAIKSDIAIFAIHTNLDNIITGVSAKMAGLLGVKNFNILAPSDSNLRRLSVYVPTDHVTVVSEAMFQAGAGRIGNYSECSFKVEGRGSFKPEAGSNPFTGEQGRRSETPETRVELVFPAYIEEKVVGAMKQAHPYEEVAFGIFEMKNPNEREGAGVIGNFDTPLSETALLALLAKTFGTPVIRHSPLSARKIHKIAICGGSGSFLTGKAIAAGADAFITADLKYHEFFDAEDKILLADIGHFESEQFTIDLIFDKLTANFTNFAVLKTGVSTNPVRYFSGKDA